jgi:hypothetical protein
MRIRELGLRSFELETGPFAFLVSHGVPVAYRDRRPEAAAPGLYRTDKAWGKATTRHLNSWLKGKGPYATLPHDLITEAFSSISRYAGASMGARTW